MNSNSYCKRRRSHTLNKYIYLVNSLTVKEIKSNYIIFEGNELKETSNCLNSPGLTICSAKSNLFSVILFNSHHFTFTFPFGNSDFQDLIDKSFFDRRFVNEPERYTT